MDVREVYENVHNHTNTIHTHNTSSLLQIFIHQTPIREGCEYGGVGRVGGGEWMWVVAAQEQKQSWLLRSNERKAGHNSTLYSSLFSIFPFILPPSILYLLSFLQPHLYAPPHHALGHLCQLIHKPWRGKCIIGSQRFYTSRG